MAKRGMASMDAEKQREIARKGGLTASQDRVRMAEIGRLGGLRSAEVRRNKKQNEVPTNS